MVSEFIPDFIRGFNEGLHAAHSPLTIVLLLGIFAFCFLISKKKKRVSH